MKPITLFYLKNCPFCKKAEAAIGELQKQDRYKDIEINRIEESVHPEIADKYDYYYVSSRNTVQIYRYESFRPWPEGFLH